MIPPQRFIYALEPIRHQLLTTLLFYPQLLMVFPLFCPLTVAITQGKLGGFGLVPMGLQELRRLFRWLFKYLVNKDNLNPLRFY